MSGCVGARRRSLCQCTLRERTPGPLVQAHHHPPVLHSRPPVIDIIAAHWTRRTAPPHPRPSSATRSDHRSLPMSPSVPYLLKVSAKAFRPACVEHQDVVNRR